MKNKNHPKFNKKSLPAIAIAVVLLGAIGLTFAISQDRSSIPNGISINQYKTKYTEVFNAPTDWKTCQKIDKTITVTNDQSSPGPVSVRVKLEEQWLNSNNTELPLVSANSGLTMAQINFTENSGWTKDGSYYYYDTDLEPGQTTTSLLTGVTLNCEANLDSDSGADRAYAGKNYHLKVTAQTIEAENKDAKTRLNSLIASKSVSQCDPDFTRGAKISDDPTIANCNGVNPYTEKDQTVYYYRGEIYDNNVIWGNVCWKIMRTTYSGGTKLVYNGLPTTVDGKQQCLANDANTALIRGNYITTYYNPSRDTVVEEQHNNSNQFPINYYDAYHSGLYTYADVGYMHGDRIYPEKQTKDSTVYVFSKGVSRNGDTYTLDTGAGQSVSGTWNDAEEDIYTGNYLYFCTDGTSVCDNTKIGFLNGQSNSREFSYYPLNGFDDINAFVEAAFENKHDSIAKDVIETWFVNTGLDTHENDLEDAIYCNDKSIKSSSLFGMSFAGYQTNKPYLNCPIQRDAFTKSDTVNGNGKLGHKVGLLTANEFIMVGMNAGNYMTTYLATVAAYNWTMTPNSYSAQRIDYSVVGSNYMFTRAIFNDISGFRPVVSLKSDAKVSVKSEGTKTDPYVIEF